MCSRCPVQGHLFYHEQFCSLFTMLDSNISKEQLSGKGFDLFVWLVCACVCCCCFFEEGLLRNILDQGAMHSCLGISCSYLEVRQFKEVLEKKKKHLLVWKNEQPRQISGRKTHASPE